MTIPLPKRPSLPRKPARAGGRKPAEGLGLPQLSSTPLTDQFGLALSWSEGLGNRQRSWLALAYEELGFDKRIPPSQQGNYGSSGTIPEMVFLGGLLSRGLRHIEDYEFQSEALGGRRFPGGAVLDFLVYTNGLRVGVRVESVFHASDFVFAGNAKVREDDSQRIRLESSGVVDRVVQVNRQSDGYPLEGASESLADADLDRVLNVT
jgi:hypothetical protein